MRLALGVVAVGLIVFGSYNIASNDETHCPASVPAVEGTP